VNVCGGPQFLGWLVFDQLPEQGAGITHMRWIQRDIDSGNAGAVWMKGESQAGGISAVHGAIENVIVGDNFR
jgi:hypothetical protein